MKAREKTDSHDAPGREIGGEFREETGGRKRSGGRFSAQSKQEAILSWVRGEDVELLSRRLGVTAATLSDWRQRYMRGGQAALKIRQADEKDEQIMRLKAKIGDLTMSNELLEQKIDRMENGFPLPRGRSKR